MCARRCVNSCVRVRWCVAMATLSELSQPGLGDMKAPRL